MVLSSSTVNMGMLLNHLLLALSIGAQMTQPLLCLSRFLVILFRPPTQWLVLRIPIRIGTQTETDEARGP